MMVLDRMGMGCGSIPEREWGSRQGIGFQSGVGFQTGDGVAGWEWDSSQGLGSK